MSPWQKAAAHKISYNLPRKLPPSGESTRVPAHKPSVLSASWGFRQFCSLQLHHLSAGLFDPVKETDRLRKQEAKVQKALAGLQGRLANRRFLDNAAPAVVQEVKQQQVGRLPCGRLMSRWPLLPAGGGNSVIPAAGMSSHTSVCGICKTASCMNMLHMCGHNRNFGNLSGCPSTIVQQV